MSVKTIRITLAAGLALAALAGVGLALAGWQATALADETPGDVGAPATLPTPWLSDDDVADAPYHSPPNIFPPPAIDGLIAPGEYAGAGKVTFPGPGGYYHEVEVFFKEDGRFLYVAFDVHKGVGKNHVSKIYLDLNPPGGGGLDDDNLMLQIDESGVMSELTGTTGSWVATTPVSWTAAVTDTLIGNGWQVEYRIEYDKLGLTPGTFQALGLGLAVADDVGPYTWPAGMADTTPSSWGWLVSSSNWDTFYWKPGPWEDYAPSGMPDFDQKQAGWLVPGGPLGQNWTHDGPAALANSLWWFDAKFETPDHAPPTISDTYRLITSYNPLVWDDHHYSNTIPLIDDLGRNYLGTNPAPGISGTTPISMFFGIHQYLRQKGLWDDYLVTMVISPSFEWVADEVQRSEDVILLLGLYEDIDPSPVERWVRVGGHYVNVAGVTPQPSPLIALSDPLADGAETGWSGGRVLSGTLLPHPPIPGHPTFVHNDAGNVSHDVYTATIPSTSPGGRWGLEEYGHDPDTGTFLFEPFAFLFGVNPHPSIQMEPYGGGPIQVEVEVAIAVSPYTWKSSGYWEEHEESEVLLDGTWTPWIDYAPNGVPDFDQKQDCWGTLPCPPTPPAKYTFCGPVAAANSLWWFDAKFEPNPAPPRIMYRDNYPMVQSYDIAPPPWDDHDPLNVDDPNTPWPPIGWPLPPAPIPPGQGEFVEDLAVWFQTDVGAPGTTIQNLYAGIDLFLRDPSHDLRQGYVITQVESPDFWWIAEEVEHSEDVILLLGFWEDIDGGMDGPWQRVGGHYVTVPGVDKQGGFVAFSDPWFDRIEQTWPLAGIGSVPGWPSYMGRVGDGFIYPHPLPHTTVYTLHNDAGNLSHDVYNVMGTNSPGGVWGPEEYVDLLIGPLENFQGQNGNTLPYGGLPVQVEVDGAVAVSPVADVGITKTTEITRPSPGEWVTFTLRFFNAGSLPAEGLVVTDSLPSGMVNPTYVGYWTSNGLPVVHRTGTSFTWDLPDLAWSEWGMITLTAQVDPDEDWLDGTPITNTAGISTTSLEQYQLPPRPNHAQVPVTVQLADVEISKAVEPDVLRAGQWLTYTLVFTNHGAAPASGVVITDQLHSWLVNDQISVTTSFGGMVSQTGRYRWGFSNPIPNGGGGRITVTAQVSPALTGGGTLANQATIATGTPESSTANNQSSANAFVEVVAMTLQPDTSTLVGNPDDTITHTLAVNNTGNVTDTYDVTGTVTGEFWSTSTPATIGPVSGGGNAQLQVTVHISDTATDGQWSRATITVTSREDGSVVDSCVLTTTAQTAPITRGVAIAPPSTMGDGDPGDTITYTLRVTNTGSAADTILLSHTKPATWTVTYASNPLNLDSGAGTDVEVYVGIPASASAGDVVTVTVTASSQLDPSQDDQAALVTRVSYTYLYLPLVMRNYP